jgi:hypothetical protein
MTNRTLAFIGIATYALSVYSTATTNGQPSVSQYVIIGSAIASILFAIFATLRIWKIKKWFSVFFATMSLFQFIAELIKETSSPSYGSSLIIAINIVVILAFLSFVYAIIVLWKTKDNIE